ncbi:hypothetical protein [Jiangella endophytica]|uniref:hypothetical protein n=1 Tax=Jiangella endophytica TaxID=1623398 RepID=UPI000E35395D|nr:hypothetical protein [Jiangella endophytica]
MRIEDAATGASIAAAGLELTPDEARELVDSLAALLAGPAGRHEHVADADFRTELTVWIAASSPPGE